ncbi:Na+/H+ antiporter subunit E [Thermococcus sp.]
MSRMHFYLKERLEEVRKRVLYEQYAARKIPTWERIILTWMVLLPFWLVVSGNSRPANVAIGAATTLIISSLMRDMLTLDVRSKGNILQKGLYFMLVWAPQLAVIMMFRILESSVRVARNVMFMDINPGIVKIKTDLNSDTGITVLANSITLTPGTLTLDVRRKLGETYLYVHWIDVETLNREKAGEEIKGDIEEWLKKIFW